MTLGNGEARGGVLEAHRDQYQTIDFSMRLPSQTSKVVVFTPHISYRNWLYFFPVACSCRNQLLLRNWKPCRTWTELALAWRSWLLAQLLLARFLHWPWHVVLRHPLDRIGEPVKTTAYFYLAPTSLAIVDYSTLPDSHHMDTRYPSQPLDRLAYQHSISRLQLSPSTKLALFRFTNRGFG